MWSGGALQRKAVCISGSVQCWCSNNIAVYCMARCYLSNLAILHRPCWRQFLLLIHPGHHFCSASCSNAEFRRSQHTILHVPACCFLFALIHPLASTNFHHAALWQVMEQEALSMPQFSMFLLLFVLLFIHPPIHPFLNHLFNHLTRVLATLQQTACGTCALAAVQPCTPSPGRATTRLR